MSKLINLALLPLLLVLLAARSCNAGIAALHCIDNHTDVEANPQVSFCPNHHKECCVEGDCIPRNGPAAGTSKGFIVFKGTAGTNQNQGKQMTWVKPTGSGSVNEYVYLRYYLKQVSPDSSAKVLGTVCPSCGDLNSLQDNNWKEGCFKLDPTRPERFLTLTSEYFSSEYLMVEKLIILALDKGETIPCSATQFEEIKNYCSPPSEEFEFVDTEPELYREKWNVSVTLDYAETTSDLPQPVNRLPAAQGLFYFHGKPRGTNQEITRPKTSSNSRFAQLSIRYYIHHTSSADSQQYYVMPVAGKPNGVQYLDATQDFLWKDKTVELTDDGSNVSFRIGTTNGVGDQDWLIIDRMVYTQR